MPSIMPEKRKEKKTKFLKAYAKTFNKSGACEAIRINRSTLWRWLRSDPEFAQKLYDIDDSALDMAEEGLMALVKGRNLQAIKFLLKSKHPSYAQKLQIEQTTKKINIDEKRLKIFLSDPKSRAALEILAVKSLEKPRGKLYEQRIEHRDPNCSGE